ncbi:MAG: fructose-1,6-bisphosphate aldolase, partial [Gammaproteobacteria bacterium]
RMASTGSIRKHLTENTSNFDPRKFLKESTAAMREICKARYESFGSAGNASKITPVSLEKMVDYYK